MKILRSEDEIIKSWKNNLTNPLVSICCTSYNHEKFIEKNLEGFLIQETSFPFEILVYDDASTDKTVNIIKEYVTKYPNLIKPIYQKENKYSQGIQTMVEYNIFRAKGTYIAFCEGDDYWIDPYKLKIQIEEMKKYPNLDMSFHPAQEINPQKTSKILTRYSNEKKNI